LKVAGIKCVALVKLYQDLCEKLQCPFFDATSVTISSKVVGVHFDVDQDLFFGNAISEFIEKITIHKHSIILVLMGEVDCGDGKYNYEILPFK